MGLHGFSDTSYSSANSLIITSFLKYDTNRAYAKCGGSSPTDTSYSLFNVVPGYPTVHINGVPLYENAFQAIFMGADGHWICAKQEVVQNKIGQYSVWLGGFDVTTKCAEIPEANRTSYSILATSGCWYRNFRMS